MVSGSGTTPPVCLGIPPALSLTERGAKSRGVTRATSMYCLLFHDGRDLRGFNAAHRAGIDSDEVAIEPETKKLWISPEPPITNTRKRNRLCLSLPARKHEIFLLLLLLYRFDACSPDNFPNFKPASGRIGKKVASARISLPNEMYISATFCHGRRLNSS